MRYALGLILLAGCGLYTHGEDDVCLENTPGAVPALDLRDPSTGTCQPFGGGGGCGACEPCAVGTVEPDWAFCSGSCEALDETHCLAQAGCHAAYTENPAADQLPQFWQCWEVPPSGPISTGTCTGLDAQSCSEHDNCSTLYAKTGGATSFEECLPEHSAYAPGECAPAVQCAIDPPGPPACPAGTIAGITPGASPCLSSSYTGYCIPQADCGQQIDPGTCTDAGCDIVGPACPSGTVPGVRNACYSGFCIPASTCPQAVCTAIATEAACKARTDCVPIYQGTNCTCTPDTCTCAIETYEHCAAH